MKVQSVNNQNFEAKIFRFSIMKNKKAGNNPLKGHRDSIAMTLYKTTVDKIGKYQIVDSSLKTKLARLWERITDVEV